MPLAEDGAEVYGVYRLELVRFTIVLCGGPRSRGGIIELVFGAIRFVVRFSVCFRIPMVVELVVSGWAAKNRGVWGLARVLARLWVTLCFAR